MHTLELPPVEHPTAREAILEGYRTLMALKAGGILDWVASEGDSHWRDYVNERLEVMQRNMSPNLLCTVLPSHTKVRFATDRNRPGETQDGILRDGNWGMIPGRRDANQRRITTNGWELFVDETTAFTHFEILED